MEILLYVPYILAYKNMVLEHRPTYDWFIYIEIPLEATDFTGMSCSAH